MENRFFAEDTILNHFYGPKMNFKNFKKFFFAFFGVSRASEISMYSLWKPYVNIGWCALYQVQFTKSILHRDNFSAFLLELN